VTGMIWKRWAEWTARCPGKMLKSGLICGSSREVGSVLPS
jgi:hypothetical protein